jgi:hypothetical protein
MVARPILGAAREGADARNNGRGGTWRRGDPARPWLRPDPKALTVWIDYKRASSKQISDSKNRSTEEQCDFMTFRIAGQKTNDQWRAMRASLLSTKQVTLWEAAIAEFFLERLKTRYLVPIKTLIEDKKNAGEGFSIVAIQCSLIEFLEATRIGKTYKHSAKESATVYSNSKELFLTFLISRVPFSSHFSKASALDFYENVRCGVLHEARTKHGWIILAKGATDAPVDVAGRSIYRNTFQDALERYIDSYSAELLHDANLQRAFIRKFDDLADDG